MVAMLLGALDQTIVATALPTIGAEFQDMESLSWIVTAYLLTGTAVTPLVGKMADIHGPRPVLNGCIALFLVGSVMCALAPSMLWLIVGRAVQGLGGGGLIALAQTIVGLVVAPRERGKYQVYFAAVFITSSIAGPVLGGFFAEHLHWSLIFWINLPLGVVAAAMSDKALRRMPAFHHPHRLDFLGAVLMCLATAALLLALTWGGTRFAWSSVEILGLLAGSIVLWGGFSIRVATAVEPLLPIAILANQVVRTGVPAAAFAMGTLVGLSIQMPLYLEGVLGLSASASGVALIPLMAGVVVGASSAAQVMARVTHYKRLPVFGLIAAMVSMIVLALQPLDPPLWVFALTTGMTGVGLGTVLPVSTVAIQNAVPLGQIGTATGLANFFRSLGGAILTAGFGAVVIGVSGLQGTSLLEGLTSGNTGEVPLANAFHYVFIGAAIALFMSMLAILAMEERPLRGHQAPTLPE